MDHRGNHSFFCKAFQTLSIECFPAEYKFDSENVEEPYKKMMMCLCIIGYSLFGNCHCQGQIHYDDRATRHTHLHARRHACTHARTHASSQPLTWQHDIKSLLHREQVDDTTVRKVHPGDVHIHACMHACMHTKTSLRNISLQNYFFE